MIHGDNIEAKCLLSVPRSDARDRLTAPATDSSVPISIHHVHIDMHLTCPISGIAASHTPADF